MMKFCTKHYKIHILMKNFIVILLSIFANFSVVASSPYKHHPSPAPILAFMSLYRQSPLQKTSFAGFRPYK